MELWRPLDRPIFYGLFINAASLHYSLWFVALAQCLILACVMSRLLRFMLPEMGDGTFLAVVGSMVALTGVGWYAGQIMPDMFTAVAILVLPLLIFPSASSRFELVIYWGIFVFSLIVHTSNSVILFALVAMVWLIRHIPGVAIKWPAKPVFWMACVGIVSSVLLSVITTSYKGGFKASAGGPVILMARMLDSGVLKTFLDEHCEGDNYILCQIKDRLPEDSPDLFWPPNSTVNQLGGWQAVEEPFQEIIRDILKEPKLVVRLAFSCLTSSLSQLFQNRAGSGLEEFADQGGYAASGIQKHFPAEVTPFRQSRQNTNLWGQSLHLDPVNGIIQIFFYASGLFLLFLFSGQSVRSSLSAPYVMVVIVLILGVISNAVVTASLANVYERLQARVSWLIPFLAILGLYQWIFVRPGRRMEHPS